ncbi:hypothetical protein GCM10027040_18600 [Halomonas shantousis]
MGYLKAAWQQFSQPPAPVPVEYRRNYEIFVRIYLLATLAHALYIPIIVWLDSVLLSNLNLMSILLNLVALLLHRRGSCTSALIVQLFGVTVLITISTVMLGAGADYYFFVIFFELLISDLQRRAKLGLGLALFILALGSVHFSTFTMHAWHHGSMSREMLRSVNLGAVFLLFSFVVLQLYVITERVEKRYRVDASHDSLTGVLNRRAIFELAGQYWQQGRGFTLLLLDADHFKSVNDTYGHSAGDEVLRHLSQTLKKTLREGDVLGRVGGEEFLVLLPGAGREEALQVAAKLRRRLAESPCRLHELTLPVTLSMGLALSREAALLDGVVELADRRLYAAKSSGRDQLVAEGHEVASCKEGVKDARGRLAQGVSQFQCF